MPTLHPRRRRSSPLHSSVRGPSTAKPAASTKRRTRSAQGGDRVDGLLRTLEAVRDGDFTVRASVRGNDALSLVETTFNEIVERNELLTRELLRVSQRVGRDGDVHERASMSDSRGGWATSIGAVNALITDLARPTNDVERVISAVVRGDLSQRMVLHVDGRPLRGEFHGVSTTVNGLVEQLTEMSSEVTRVARAVGEEGKLGAQVEIAGASGTWRELTNSVNMLAGNLTNQVRAIADITTAVANGDLSRKISVEARGEILELKDTINAMVDQLRTFAAEVTRVAKEVGTEGKLGGQADVKGASGTWKDLTDSVNVMAGNLTGQVRGIVKVVTAVANGDLSQKFVFEAKGEIAALADTINGMTETLRTFAEQVTTVAREVGIEGKLGGQARVPGVSGTWKDLTDNVNVLAGNLTNQVRNIALVTTAVAKGDLSQKITVDAQGEILALKSTINVMVDQLRAFASEVTRVATEVGTQGVLGGQADVQGVSGTWKDLTNSVNMLAGNLTNQVRNIALVTTAVAKGDLSQKITVDARGEILELKSTVNTMVDQLRTFAAEVTRVAKEVGTEGKLGGQADVKGVSGTWKDLTDNVNVLAGNLTNQVRNIALVTTAVANGDMSQKITVDVKGEILELKNTINAMVDRLRAFASEVTRVAREVGTEGKLGGQAQVPGVAGTWKDLTDNVNQMASNLTNQVRGIVKVVTAVATGDLSQKLAVEAKGEVAALSETINAMTDTLRTFADQVTTVAREVGIEGTLGGQARVPGAAGTWRDLTDNVNMLAGNLTSQVRNIALVTTALANGDLSQKITVDAQGEILALKNTINATVEQLRTFAAEVTRVAREVGTEGKLGGQAEVPGVAGTWKDLTDNVNQMASNLTGQVRGIVKVVTSVANGDLTKKLSVEAKGEIAALADTINGMTETLRTFAEQVTTVAREVGIEGKLGGQARVPGASGTWRDLVDNVNQLAGNLTTQVRAISNVATAVTKGDLTGTIDVGAQGEVLSLKDTINQMIANLRDTTQTNKEQDWLKTNLAKFTAMMQGQRSLESLAQLLMSELTPAVSSQIGTFFVLDGEPNGTSSRSTLRLLSSYGYVRRKGLANAFAIGEGLVGQAALEKKAIVVGDVPDEYVHVSSSIGEHAPRNIVVLPVLFEGRVKGVIELGSFQAFSQVHLTFLEQLMLNVGVVFNMISASRRTEELLQELQSSNAALEGRSKELEDKASQLEVKNREIAEASDSLEEKARQLALVSRYKSEFLANMSHELRTPLNSMLILSNLLVENGKGNLSAKELEYVKTIAGAGHDLLALISQILDLSKIEAGKMQIDRRPMPLSELRGYVEGQFRPIAQQKGLEFTIRIAHDAPSMLTTDSQRVEQILKNLLSNAFKFTEKGRVSLEVALVRDTRHFNAPGLRDAGAAVAFTVEDTGIGICSDKRQIIFEAFQQADASTSRTHGGTGLGLTICRELARLLGGEIALESVPGKGSVFTLYLPLEERSAHARAPEPQAPATLAPPTPPSTPPAPSTAPPPARDETSGPALAHRKVLVVDDDVRNLFAVTSLLESQGAVPLSASNAHEALDLLERHADIDVVLMDIMMPEVDGYEATRRIRAVPRFSRLPVVALTAKAMPGDREKCLAAGCNDFVSKPVDAARLVQTILRTVPSGQ